MTAAHPEAARAGRVRHALMGRAADLANSLHHDPLTPANRPLGLTLAGLHTDATVVVIGALAKAARAGVRPWSSPDHAAAASPRLMHPVAPLLLAPRDDVNHLWPRCALCDAPVERATITQDLARCSTVITAQCHGERETMTISDALLEDRGHRDLVAFRGAARRAVNGS